MGSGGPRIGVIGGSGLYALMEADGVERDIRTPSGTARVTVGTFADRSVAFLPRHGAGHAVPPHRIDYRSNIWALASLGVRVIVSSSAVGGLHPDYPPGTLVLTDQLVDRTSGRPGTFFEDGSVQHLTFADPFDPELHGLALRALEQSGERVAPRGTVVVIPGPRFSTRAESTWFREMGAHTVNMTMAPEVPLAAELGIRTVNLSFVTDSDAGAVDGSDAVDASLVFRRLAEAQPRIVAAIRTIVAALPEDPEPGTGVPPEAVAEVLARPVPRPPEPAVDPVVAASEGDAP